MSINDRSQNQSINSKQRSLSRLSKSLSLNDIVINQNEFTNPLQKYIYKLRDFIQYVLLRNISESYEYTDSTINDLVDFKLLNNDDNDTECPHFKIIQTLKFKMQKIVIELNQEQFNEITKNLNNLILPKNNDVKTLKKLLKRVFKRFIKGETNESDSLKEIRTILNHLIFCSKEYHIIKCLNNQEITMNKSYYATETMQ